jgi:DNA-binding transcriptional LysR family regulator
LSTLVVPAAAGIGGAGGLQVTVVQGAADDLAAGVRDGSVHVALCFQDAAEERREHEAARRTDVLDEPMLAAVGPGHRLAGRRRVRLAELADDPWLTSAPDGLIVRACAAAGFEPRIAFLTNDPLAINAFVETGMAVTLVAKLLAAQLRGIATLPIAGAPVARTIYALTPHGGRHPLVEPFLDAVRAAAAPS